MRVYNKIISGNPLTFIHIPQFILFIIHDLIFNLTTKFSLKKTKTKQLPDKLPDMR